MQKKIAFFVVCILVAGALAACNLPGTTLVPTAAGQQITTLATLPVTSPAPTNTAILPTKTSLPPTKTSIPPTETSLPPTESRAVGPAVVLDQIHMVDAKNGWSWASRAGNMNQLLRSTDGGQTWLDVSPQGDYVYTDSYFFNEQAAWLSYYNSTTNLGGILHTSDGGKTWVTLPQNDAIQNALIEFTSPTDGTAETAGVGAGNAYLNYYRTQDGGLTWTPILLTAPTPEPGLKEGTVHLCNICGDGLYYDPARALITYGDMASDPTGAVRLAISTDLGQHWKNIKIALPTQYATGSTAPQSPAFFGNDGLLPVSVSKYNQDGTLAFSVLLIYSSQDGGQNWQATPAILENQQIFTDTVRILSAKDAFVRCGRNLCSTNDGAQTWHKLPDNLNFDQAAGGPDYVSQYYFIDPANGWAISGDSGATTLWKSSDGGATWTTISPTLIP